MLAVHIEQDDSGVLLSATFRARRAGAPIAPVPVNSSRRAVLLGSAAGPGLHQPFDGESGDAK